MQGHAKEVASNIRPRGVCFKINDRSFKAVMCKSNKGVVLNARHLKYNKTITQTLKGCNSK